MRLLKAQLALGAAALAALGWTGLLAAMPAAVLWLCGPEGLSPSVAAWDAARLSALLPMWCAMMAAMALPCAVVALLLEPTRQVRLPSYVLMLLFLGFAAALMQWTLDSAGLRDSIVVWIALIAAVLLLEIGKWRGTAPRLASALQMVALQLLGPMTAEWMGVLMLWMLADALMPERPTIAVAFGGVDKRTPAE